MWSFPLTMNQSKTHWNYRVLVYNDVEGLYFRIHEVYYADGVPNGYSQPGAAVSGSTSSDLKNCLLRMKEATEKPFLWAEERFPEEYKPE